MKKIIVIALVSFTFVACKKDRTCACTITKTGTSTTTAKVEFTVIPGFPPTPLADTSFVTAINETQVADKKFEKVTKKTAKNNCISYTEPYTENVVTAVPDSTFNFSIIVTNKGDKKYACELK